MQQLRNARGWPPGHPDDHPRFAPASAADQSRQEISSAVRLTPPANTSSYRIADLPGPVAANSTIDDTSGCWVVSPGDGIRLDRDGYARYRGQFVHRLVYVELVGEIPASRPVIDHVKARGCIWRNCAFPVHLEPVTVRTNTLRGTSFAAVNFAKDECDHGHPFDLLGTYWRPDGHRDCRVCIRRRVREYKARQRAAAAAAGIVTDLGRAA